MPELPEVETWRRLAQRAAAGKSIRKAVTAEDRIIFDQNDPADLARQLRGQEIIGTARRGKYSWLRLGNGKDLMLHFGMSGSLWWLHPEDPDPSHLKLQLHLSDGTRLAYRNLRRIGRIRYLDDAASTPPISTLGPDPLEENLSLAWMRKQLSKRNTPLTAALVDETLFAGVGNWIADEVLYQARIDPQRCCRDLSAEEIKILRSCLMRILRKAVEVEADAGRFPKSWLFHYRWGKKALSDAAGEAIRFDQVGGRTTAWVPSRCGLTPS
ncbi:MAG: Fpg/Nei family DNA glycosylase [Kiritimatiellia bacterium]